MLDREKHSYDDEPERSSKVLWKGSVGYFKSVQHLDTYMESWHNINQDRKKKTILDHRYNKIYDIKISDKEENKKIWQLRLGS